MGEVYHHPGKKVCGSETIRRTVKCLCEKGKKQMVATSYWVEKECVTDSKKIDHNQAEACLEALEAEDYGQLCKGEVPDEDERSGWELIRLEGPGRKWLIDPPETSFGWWPLGLMVSGLVLNLGILAWRAVKKKSENETARVQKTNDWFVVASATTR